jgi:hypothetical protein
MSIGSGTTRVSDLKFQVFDRALHPEWFAVRAHRRFSGGGCSADVHLVEGGHVLIVAFGETRLTQVLSGPGAQLPEAGLLLRTSVRHERSALLRPSPRVEYQVCVEAERAEPEVFAHLCAELSLDAGRVGLFRRAATANRLAPVPLTHVVVAPGPRRLAFQATHTFPEDHTIVRVLAQLEPRSP